MHVHSVYLQELNPVKRGRLFISFGGILGLFPATGGTSVTAVGDKNLRTPKM